MAETVYTPDITVLSGVNMKRNNLIGQRFFRLVVTGEERLCAKQNVLWRCLCDCGGTAVAYAYDLRAGKVKSCGCLSREGLAAKHGYARQGNKRNRVYSVWASMIQRCTNPSSRGYHYYGGRGITVCKRWLKFENFLADMGEPPAGMTLERIKNEKGYSASNCRWASVEAQARNKRSNVWVKLRGKSMLLKDALLKLQKDRGSLHYWMKKLQTDHQGVIDLWA